MTVDRLVYGLGILTKYSSRGRDALVEAQHDIIYFDPSVQETDVSADDRADLDRLGWHFSSEGGWACFT